MNCNWEPVEYHTVRGWDVACSLPALQHFFLLYKRGIAHVTDITIARSTQDEYYAVLHLETRLSVTGTMIHSLCEGVMTVTEADDSDPTDTYGTDEEEFEGEGDDEGDGEPAPFPMLGTYESSKAVWPQTWKKV